MVYQPVEAQLNNSKMNSRLFSILLRIIGQRVLEQSRLRKYYRVLRRLRKTLFLLGKHSTLIFKKSMPFLFVRISIVFFLIAVCYLFSLCLGSIDVFHGLLSKDASVSAIRR